jgi:4-hydroxy-3-polyprenylbenzoate decarboxylase
VIVARTPDGRWTNWSIARIMPVDGKHMTGLVSPPQQRGLIWQEWARLGKPMPYALVQGGDPAIPFVGGIPLAAGTDEAGYIGALYGEPVEVVKFEAVDLEVPASAEIVIEGHLSLGRGDHLPQRPHLADRAGRPPGGRSFTPSPGPARPRRR